MTDTEQKIEVEIEDVVSSQDNIQQMMDKMADGDVTGAGDAFNSIMGERADQMVAARKGEVADAIFNSPEMIKMGLAPSSAESDSTD